MRSLVKLGVALPALALAAACGRGGDSAIADDLQSDLDRAQVAGNQLAVRPYNANQVVSAIEAAPAGKQNVGDRAPRPKPKRKAPPEVVATPTPLAELAEAPVADAVEDAPAPAEEVAVADAPAPAPTVEDSPAPAEQPEVITAPGSRADPDEGRGDVGGWAGVIGVVLRGGHGGIDNCDPRIDGRRGGVIAVGTRFPTSGGWGGGYVIDRPMGGSLAGERTRIGGERSRGTLRMPAGPGMTRGTSGGRTRF